MKVKKTTALVAGGAALALALAACSSSGGGNPPASNSDTGSSSSGGSGTSSSAPSTSSSPTSQATGSGSVVFGESTDWPENLQGLISAGNAVSTANIEINTNRGVYQIVPAIKYSVDPAQGSGTPTDKIVNGQQVVTVKLNPDAKWADGQPLTAADYAFTFQTLKSTNPKQGGCASLLSTTGYDQVASVTTPSTYTIVVKFKKGMDFPDWQSLFTAPLSKHVYDQGSAAKTCAYITKGFPIAGGIPAGAQNGPWMLEPSKIDVNGKTVALVPNPYWNGDKPKLATLIDTYIGSDSDTNVKALQNGDVNMVNPQPQLDLVANLDKLSSSVTTKIQFGLDYEHLDFNTKDPLLAHKEIRQAIAYGINRPALVNATVGKFSDQATVLGNHLLVTNQPGYKNNGQAYDQQNIAKAKSLLSGIGCNVSSSGTTCFGKPLTFKISTTQQNPLRDQTIAIIANQLKPLGIKMTEFADENIFGDKTDPTSLTAEGFQIALFAWEGGPAISASKSIYISPKYGQQQNYSQGGTTQIDAALNKMSSAANTTAETAAANAADKLLWAQMYTLPLYQKPVLVAYSKGISGVQPNPTQAGPLWNSQEFATAG